MLIGLVLGFVDEDVGIRQKFGLATDSSYAVSGILGLGYGIGYTINYANILDSLVKFDLINAPIYSVSLGGQGQGTSKHKNKNLRKRCESTGSRSS